MVEVKNQNPDSKFRSQSGEQVKQRHRIRSAGDTHPNAISRPNHRMPVDGLKDPLLEFAVHSIVRIPLDSALIRFFISWIHGSKTREETHNLARGSKGTACRSR
jgi:hypothetical protein